MMSLLLISSFAFYTSKLTHAQENNITFTSGETINFSSDIEMTFRSTASMKFGTTIKINFYDTPIPGNGIIQPCDILEITFSSPPGFIPPVCSWWEVIDPITGDLLGEFHVDAIYDPAHFHIDMVWPGPIIYQLGPPLIAIMKVSIIQPCETYEVHKPAHWWPEPCTWWEIIDPETGRTGYCFHVDWTNESCEFHVDVVEPGSYQLVFPAYEVEAVEWISEIETCDWFEIVDPQGFNPDLCSWWEILDQTGAPTGLEFHVDQSGGGMFHVDFVTPDPLVIPWAPTDTVTARKKISIIQQCDWFKVDNPSQTPMPCSWWRIISPKIGDVEFHVDIANPDGTFHVDTVIPVGNFDPPVYMVTAERKIDDIAACDWFKITDPLNLPQPCSWWRIISPQEWAGIIFHVDSNDGINKFHIDTVEGTLPPISIPPYSVTAEPYEPTPPSWYVKPPFPDYAPSGMPDFDQKQDMWGPGQGIYTWCGPVAVANSLWWLDSEFESIINPAPLPPPIVSDSFPLVTAYGQWDDHDPLNVDPLTRELAWWMDTDGQRSGDMHIGTRWQDMVFGIQQYLAIHGVMGMFEVHFGEFPEFGWIEYEIERCQDVVLFLEFWQFTGTWIPLYDNPSLEFGHFVTCAGVNSTTFQLLISDPYQDAYENGFPGRSPVLHPPHVDPTVHNDAQFVSQDAYGVALWMGPPSPYGPIPVWELVGYLQTMGYDPSWHAFIRTAVITSPTIAVPDINITSVESPAIVNRGDTSSRPHVNVTVLNEGGDPVSFFDIFVYAVNLTDEVEIGVQTIDELGPGESIKLTFWWNTSSYTIGNYSIKGYAPPLPGEIDIEDNTRFRTGDVIVKLVGDLGSGTPPQFFKFDGKVDGKDLSLFLQCFKGTAPPEAKFLGDLGGGTPPQFFLYDGKVDGKDLSLFLQCFKGAGP